MGDPRIMLRYWIKNKKNRFWLQKCPFNHAKNVNELVIGKGGRSDVRGPS